MHRTAIALCTLLGSLGLAGSALANTLTIQLPSGATETIRYAGNVAPQISIRPAQAAEAFDEAPLGVFAPDPIFAAMERQSAAMARETAALINVADALASQSFARLGPAIPIDAANLPPGTTSYSVVATLSPKGACTQSMTIISQGTGQQPRVIRRSSGDCQGASNAAVPDAAPGIAPPRHRAKTYSIDAPAASHKQPMLREAAWEE
ncbi:MAG TPA: hypothetical protein VJR47_19305 [Stellaceae bacterium]|nr:hypothetical protein [Stellaceae bacterium]